MDHVATRSGIFKERREAPSAFGFHRFRTARFMPVRTCLSFRQQLLLQARYQFCVLAMRSNDHAEALGKFQGLVHFTVIHTEKILVSKKNLKRRRSISNDLSQL